MVIGVDGERKVVVETGGVAQQEPQMRVAGRALGGALGESLRLRVMALLQSQLRGACEARILNVRSPSQRLPGRRLVAPLLRFCRTFGAHLIRLCASNANQDEEENRQNCNLQKPESDFGHTV
jgi:hypothetical protein